ncbi:hypothetical protein BC941DRAFT_430954 [Chlamydoabsidia padenii]|nr:hypothetical protein BC941DRAFT_430954 [Chlamydoabsidia padenii]
MPRNKRRSQTLTAPINNDQNNATVPFYILDPLMHHIPHSVPTLPPPPTFNDNSAKPETFNNHDINSLPEGYHKWALWLSQVFGPPNDVPQHMLLTSDQRTHSPRHRPHVTFRIRPRLNDPVTGISPVSSPLSPSTLDNASVSSSNVDDIVFAAPTESVVFDQVPSPTRRHADESTTTINDSILHQFVDVALQARTLREDLFYDPAGDSDTCSFYSAQENWPDSQSDLITSSYENQSPKELERPKMICHLCHQTDIPASTLDSLGITKRYMLDLVNTKHLRPAGYTGTGKYWDPSTLIHCHQCTRTYHCGCPDYPIKHYPS